MLRFHPGIAAAAALFALCGCAALPRVPLASAPQSAAAPAALQAGPQPAPLADLVRAVDIPWERFTLANGLTTIVHTDRKAPVVGVTIYYRAGAKHEPRGKTGFAHLYEHLFFGGSENVPNFDIPLEAAGSTPTNGSTSSDRTNYVETVPAGALDLALFMESDRMGHLLGAVTQDKLNKQRGVVQNEKRQGDNDPYGLADYAINEGLFPVGHPYRHSVIGSMADLDAARLGDVRQWFRDNYGPNNAVLVLTGDIDAAAARPLVEKWFGAIPRGPQVRKVEAGPVTLAAPARREMTDRAPVLRLTRNWSGPGVNDPDAPALEVAMRILGGLASSRLDNRLVRGEELAVAVTAGAQTYEQVSLLQAAMDVRLGVDRAKAEARFDALIAQFIADGPDEDEVRRAAASTLSAQIGALEQVGGLGGKGAVLAEGQLFSGDPGKYKADLARIAALTPQDIRAAMQRWLTRPAFMLAIAPGERNERGEVMGGWGDAAAIPVRRPSAPPAPRIAPRISPSISHRISKAPARAAPPVAPVSDLAFPRLERATLANGIPVVLVRRSAVPKLLVEMEFDAGWAADALDLPGAQGLMLAMLDQGTASRSATRIAEEQERLGARIEIDGGIDASTITLSTLAANLAPSLALMADVVRRPAFAESEVARVRQQQLANLAQTLAEPAALARRELARLLYGAHPYAQPGDGLGDAASLAALTPEALRAAHAKWLRPDAARIIVTGDIALERLAPLLDRAFGDWQAPPSHRPVKDIAAPVPAPRPRIVLIDRPGSPQSVIVAGRVLPLTGRDQGMEALDLANEVLGGGFLSRLNLDLREDKGWSYGVSSAVTRPVGPRAFTVTAPVQTDRTGDAIRLLLADMLAFPSAKPVDAQELGRVTQGNIRGLPNRFETNAQVLGALATNLRLGRPDDYYATLASRWQAIGAREIDGAARRFLALGGLTFVVVGERRAVEPQLRRLGLPLEYAAAPDAGH